MVLNRVAAAGWGDAFETVLFRVGPFRPTLDDLAHGFFMLNPTSDALATLLVVKVYRDAALSYLNKVTNGLRKKTTVVVLVAQVCHLPYCCKASFMTLPE